MQPQTRSKLLIFVSLAITGLILVIIIYLAKPIIEKILGGIKNDHPTSANMSIGNRLLIGNFTDEKKEAIKYFEQGNYEKAEEFFKKSLAKNLNDPEGLIYEQNSEVQAKKEHLKIAVVIPANNSNVAQEILRGVASAQREINQQGGVNGQKLLILIADDQNSPGIAKTIAEELIKDDKILAVIGSNASDPSLAAAPIYKQAGLVMITPTSSADGLSSQAWRLVPSNKISGEVLATQIVNVAKKTKIAICYNSAANDNISFKDELIASLLSKKATIIPLGCNFDKSGFNPVKMMDEITKQGADGLFASTHVNRVEDVILLAQINQGKLPLFSNSVMYNVKTLVAGQVFKGLTLFGVYHPDLNPSFAAKMEKEWKGRVSWRTATSFDAASVIINILKQAQTRAEIEQVLRNPQFSIQGATGVVKFDPVTGDRIGKPVIVQVQETSKNQYDFVLQR